MTPNKEGNREGKVRERAYSIWEEEGYPHGRDVDHWLRAEGELGGQPGSKPKRSSAKKSTTKSAGTRSRSAGKTKSSEG